MRTLAQRWSTLDTTRRFVLPDLLGHGESAPLPPAASTDVLARAVLDHVARMDDGPVGLLGHSLGGRVALAALRVAPARVRDIVLLDIAPGPLDPKRAESGRVLQVLLAAPHQVGERRDFRAFLLREGLSEPLTDWLLMNVQRDGEGYGWRFDRNALHELHQRFYEDDLWPVVEAAPVPIRCFRGALSSYVTEADVERMRGAHCDVQTIAGAGHFVHVDGLDSVLELLQD